jgi:hypothetical protein
MEHRQGRLCSLSYFAEISYFIEFVTPVPGVLSKSGLFWYAHFIMWANLFLKMMPWGVPLVRASVPAKIKNLILFRQNVIQSPEQNERAGTGTKPGQKRDKTATEARNQRDTTAKPARRKRDRSGKSAGKIALSH